LQTTSNIERERKFIPSLEGIRGYGFLFVFFAHYLLPWALPNHHSFVFFSWKMLKSLAYFAVPMFFVLSGYLIGGILYETRQREGFFRVFYLRRILRVFPVYYLTLIVVACIDIALRFHLDYRFWINFLYIQNFLLEIPKRWSENPVPITHFWSLAVEEQFYLVWPLVVWFFPQRRKLIGITCLLISVSWAVRLAAPILSLTLFQILYLTPTRVDGILLGVLLALLRGSSLLERIKPWAKWFALAGILGVVVRAALTVHEWPTSYLGTEIMLPLLNLVALAIVIEAMQENGWVNRVCSKSWICWLGGRSYSLYIFHYIFYQWYERSLLPALSVHMRILFAIVTGSLIILALTLVLSMLSYRYLEAPALRMKKHIRYGDAVADRERTSVLAGT
jgi:peptidoglycan/LPS O-acetylase OafA/YrhL